MRSTPSVTFSTPLCQVARLVFDESHGRKYITENRRLRKSKYKDMGLPEARFLAPGSFTRRELPSFSLKKGNWKVRGPRRVEGGAKPRSPIYSRREIRGGRGISAPKSEFGHLFRWGSRHSIRPWRLRSRTPPISASGSAGLQLPWNEVLGACAANLSHPEHRRDPQLPFLPPRRLAGSFHP